MLLEVIVTSVAEAVEAEIGGADRIELVRELSLGGLSPEPELVEDVLRETRTPVRVMLRENATLGAGGPDELKLLARQIDRLAKLPIDGVVLGFAKKGKLDLDVTRTLLARAPELRGTFHRAFDEAHDAIAAIRTLRELPQIDRILTNGGPGSVPIRIARLRTWQELADPAIRILAGVGLCEAMLVSLKHQTSLSEVHVGRAARLPRDVTGKVDRHEIAALKSALT